MAKFKPVKPKTKSRAAPRGGLPCVIVLFSGLVLLLFFMYFILKNASG